jgi:DNA adenine methylase
MLPNGTDNEPCKTIPMLDRLNSHSLLSIFSTFYLNRTSRSGILLGGIIGGKNQDGPWKLDARFNKDDLIYRIKKIARFASRITVTQLDGVALLESLVRDPPAKCFLYIDPPYYMKGQDLYPNFYEHNDHLAVAAVISRLQVPWIVSYDATQEIAAMYRDYEVIEYGLSYSASRRYSGNELMFFSPGLSMPNGTDPRSVEVADVNRLKLATLARVAHRSGKAARTQ